MKPITKTDFISYRECPNNMWVKLHMPEVYAKFPVSEFEQALGAVGNKVEEAARKMFPQGVLIEGRGAYEQDQTKKLIADKTPVIFQAVFSSGKYLAATDVLVWNPIAQRYDLFEIKMSSAEDDEDGKARVDKKKEEQYEYDLAFQSNVLHICGVQLNDKFLIRLNRNYIRSGDLDYRPGQLFAQELKTAAINKLMPVALIEMEQAYAFLSAKQNPPGPCPCYYKGRNSHCTTFSFTNPHVPEYSVHDLNRIGNSKKYLRELLDEGILEIDKVPIDDRIIPKQAKEGEKPAKPRKLNQVQVYKSKEPIIDLKAIKAELDSLKFPLYFLDYETYPAAIPIYNGYRPYQNIVFQYSLHILTEEDFKKGSGPRHVECLILEGDPAERIVESLKTHIGKEGRIISWYKSFENSRNKELAYFVPSETAFLKSVIDRTYDLMDIVEGQYYVHHKFKGSSSIKKVQPVIAPDFSYKALGVQNGTDAIEAYRKLTEGELTGAAAEEKRLQMLEYCKYDTEIMYLIWKFFVDLVEKDRKQESA